jgi:hypothetical protein
MTPLLPQCPSVVSRKVARLGRPLGLTVAASGDATGVTRGALGFDYDVYWIN